MRVEALEAPAVAARLLAADAELYAALVASLQQDDPQAVLTVARGSSDHAAQHLGYLVMARLGRLVTSLPMSVVTLYASRLRCQGLVSLALSQSGQSPDLVAPSQYFSDGGARTVALVNDVQSPLAQACQWVLPLHAGAETSVAATKSFIAQLVAGARLVALWEQALGRQEGALLPALAGLPAALVQAAQQDWTAALPALVPAQRLFVIGRGTGLAVAQEAALKLKETCGLQAEAYSGAELRHGPMALVEAGYPVLVLATRGPAQAGLLALVRDLRAWGAQVLLAVPPGTPGLDVAIAATGAPAASAPLVQLPLVATAHEELDAVSAVQSFYLLAEALARARGLDPDAPRHLAKVTRTR